jgi:hypothetical protein
VAGVYLEHTLLKKEKADDNDDDDDDDDNNNNNNNNNNNLFSPAEWRPKTQKGDRKRWSTISW